MGSTISYGASRHPQNYKGHHECAIFGKGPEAAERAAHWETCRKNPGHRNFVEAKDFCIDDLPEALRKRELFDIYKAIAKLTVRLRVSCVSGARPDHDGLAHHRGSDTLRTGTGFVASINTGGTLSPRSWHHSEDVAMGGDLNPCPCRECNGEVVRPWFYLDVYTVSHVVYDTQEAKSTKVDLFYDDENCLLDGRMISLWGFDAAKAVPERDSNVMRCVSHDVSLGLQLLEYLDTCTPMERSSTHNLVDINSSLTRGITLIISHPHGQTKKVTWGKVKSIVNTKNGFRWKGSKGPVRREMRQFDSYTAWEYDAATCPGSSGAMVLIVDQWLSLSGVMHSGANIENKNEANYSATGSVWGKFLNFRDAH